MSEYPLEQAGLPRGLTIDGYTFEEGIGSLPVAAPPTTTRVDTIDGGSTGFTVLAMVGSPRVSDRYTITVQVQNLEGPDLVAFERIRAGGGYHQVAYWRPIRARYTARSGQTLFYLPRYRRNAPQALAGLVYHGVPMSTDAAPAQVWVNGVALAVSYVDGPDLADPGAGAAVVANLTATEGPALDLAAFRIGNVLAAGDEVEVEFHPLFQMELTAPAITFVPVAESHTQTFMER